MYFKDIVGQENIKNELLLQVHEGRIPHTQLFCSSTGVGAYQLALAFATYLNCENRNELDSCGTCPSCIKMKKLVHPDVHYSFPVIKSKLSDDYINDWRKFVLTTPYFSLNDWLNFINAENSQAIIYAKESESIIKKLALKSSEGGYKITLIWLPEKMNEVCANKLLKSLEEPPKDTLFFLVTEAPDQLISTVLSRTQRIDIPLLSAHSIADHLQQDYGIATAISQSIAHQAHGNMNKALSEIQLNEDKTLFLNLFINIMRLAYARRVKEIKKWSEEVAVLGREKQKQLLAYSQFMVRENFINNFKRPELNFMNEEEKQFSTNFSPFINENNVYQIMEELNLAQQHIEQNANAKIVFFDFALKLIVQIKQ